MQSLAKTLEMSLPNPAYQINILAKNMRYPAAFLDHFLPENSQTIKKTVPKASKNI